MSSTKRAYNLLRGYVNREWERIRGEDAAWSELDEIGRPDVAGQPVSESTAREVAKANDRELAQKVLGVPANADFDAVRAAFIRLNRRADPGNFPPGSSEAQHAADIQKRVQWAYSLLSEGIDSTEKRFKSLEIDSS
jgi:hypothetical protein